MMRREEVAIRRFLIYAGLAKVDNARLTGGPLPCLPEEVVPRGVERNDNTGPFVSPPESESRCEGRRAPPVPDEVRTRHEKRDGSNVTTPDNRHDPYRVSGSNDPDREQDRPDEWDEYRRGMLLVKTVNRKRRHAGQETDRREEEAKDEKWNRISFHSTALLRAA